MQFKGRALYNLLQLSYKEDRSLEIEPWQIIDYRSMDSSQILRQLSDLGVPLTKESFVLYAEKCETPEELIECLWTKESDLLGQEKAYLLLFELWRRLLQERQSLSIFCDELDLKISLYDEDKLSDQERIQQLLAELENILDESVDAGAKPNEIFETVLCYCAHDIEGFLYDFILDQLEENEVYGSELIDAFYEYVSDKKWFDFLRARLFSLSDPKESDILVCRILEQQEEDPDLSFLFEIVQFLVNRGDVGLFLQSVRQTSSLLQKEEDFQKLLHLMAAFYRCLDKEKIEQSIQTLLVKRRDIHPQAAIDTSSQKVIQEFLRKEFA